MKKVFVFAFLFILTSSISAQFTIQSKVIEKKNGNPMEMTSVRLMNLKDSTLVAGSRTDSTGLFILKDVRPGTYRLNVSNIGFNDYNHTITVNKNMILPNITMEEDVKVLQEVNVAGTAVQVVVKKDTIEYNAGAFKTSENAVVEDLLKRMPGVEVSSDGKITVNGQEIKNVRVDGKKFFQGDPSMSTKNIPANMIDKVQIVDQKSEMAQLTGFEDNDTERIINLTLKQDKRRGIFGNVAAGAGADINPEFRYDANAFLNIMNDDSRSTVTAGANNVNTARSGRGRGGFGNQRSGITETQNIGYNLNIPVNKKLTVGGDVTFNHSDNIVNSENRRENYLQGETYTNNSTSSSNRENYQGNVRFEMEWKPDTLNTWVFQPNIGMNRSFNSSNSNYVYLTAADSTSWGDTDNRGNGLDLNGGLTIMYSRKFASKKGRSLTSRLTTNFSESNSSGYNLSYKFTPDSTIVLDQQNENTSNRMSVGLRVSYVEPLWQNKHFLETAISFDNNTTSSTRDLYDKDANGDYTLLNKDYSNKFDNTFFREALEMNYRFMEKDYNLMLGFKTEPSQTYSKTIYGDNTGVPISNEVVNFAPTAQFQYNFGRRQFIRFDYRGRTEQPSISQMQPVKNNTDLMNETVGNATLNPAFSHDLRFMFSTYNSKNFSSFNIGLMGRTTKDDLVNNSIYDNTGKRYIQTVNAGKMPYNLNSYLMYNTPIIQKRLQFNTNASFGINQQYGYTSKGINTGLIDVTNLQLGKLSDTRRYNASNNTSLTFTHDKIDFGVRGGITYSNSKNNFNDKAAETYNWLGAANLVLRPIDIITFSTDLNYSTMTGYADFNKEQWLWNASLDWSVFKKKAVISFRAYDILRQLQNVTQTVGDNYIQYSKTNALRSYFLVGFTYKINKFSGSKNGENPANMDNFRGPGRGMYMQRGQGGDYRGGPPPGVM